MTAPWKDRRVVVTGGCGFIGSHLVEALLELGATVVVLGSYNSRGSWGHLAGFDNTWGERLDVRLGTVTDVSLMRSVTDGADVVFHLAALISIPYSYAAPAHNVDVNVLGTLRVLEAARDNGVARVVHTSTSECFGTAQYTPMDEKHPLNAQSPYAASKISADQLALSFHRSFNLPVVVLRPFNTFGSRQSRRAVIPTIITQLLSGPEVRLGSVDPVRDMNPVSNTVDAFLRVGSAPDIEGELFVVGSGEGRTIGQIAEEIAVAMYRPMRIRTDPQRLRPASSEVFELVCDNTRITQMLGYEPRTSFAEGIRSTIDYFERHHEVGNYAI